MLDQTMYTDTGVPSAFIVDEDCIRKGTPDRTRSCMLAISVSRAGCEDACVMGDAMTFIYEGKTYWCDLEPQVANNIERYDNGDEVKPFVVYTSPERL